MKSDWIEIRLSEAGAAFAGENGAIRVASAHFHYEFTAGKTTRVLTSEWSRVLSKETYEGRPILEAAEGEE